MSDSTGRGAGHDRAAGNSSKTGQGNATGTSSARGGFDAGNGDGLREFAAELKLLAEAVLERVEPVLRQAADGQTEWSSCSWCPVCAAAALVRGEHHEVLTAVADHGTAIVTVLREALAGAPVEPVMPDPENDAPHNHSAFSEQTSDSAATDGTESGSATSDTRERDSSQQSATAGRTRARYVGIPVTIKA